MCIRDRCVCACACLCLRAHRRESLGWRACVCARACSVTPLAQDLGRAVPRTGTRPGSARPQRSPALGWVFPGVSGCRGAWLGLRAGARRCC
eukprot:7431911-Alexandrium_andersonii.AAC.1